ncbi:hypothetical protein K435DRAFT_797417 [Dendrothele bispora CBS 962.96]|uniref:Chromo domain-containing protein n=1 Tax=Dendrothele bispora (strain CBS 962.96) TaxID=1314807 RepID=A0A4S8M3S0_DENBC|nr:hypothetical protein K435DRAFT_797417 [Dendrothele bispora CBS 962.96]
MARSKKRAKTEKVEESGEDFQVEVVTAARVTEEGEWEYHVKWHGYGSDEDSWEPDSNLGNCSRLLNSFWKEVGHDNEDYTPGYICTPSPEWIRKERKRAAKNFGYDRKGMEKRAEKEREQTRKAAKKADKEKTTDFMVEDPLPKKSVSSLKTRGKERSRTGTGSTEPVAESRQVSKKRKRNDEVLEASDSPSGSEDEVKKKQDTNLKPVQAKEAEVGKRPDKTSDKGKDHVQEPQHPETSSKNKDTKQQEVWSYPERQIILHMYCTQNDPSMLFSDGETVAPPSPKKDSASVSKSKKPSLTPLSIPKPTSKQNQIPTLSGAPSAGPSSAPLLPGRAGTQSASSTPKIPTKTPSFIQQSNSKEPSIASGSNLSTKQRLAQLALTPQNPREQLQGASRKGSLGGLNFKKQQSTGSSTSVQAPDSASHPSHSPTVRSPVVPQGPRPRTASWTHPLAPASTSPTDSRFPDPSTDTSFPENDFFFDEPQSTVTSKQVPDPKSPLAYPPVHWTSKDIEQEAESFLNNISLPVPSTSSMETSQAKAAPSRMSSLLLTQKIPKKWKWTGKIELHRGDETEVVCEQAILSDTTAVLPEGMPFLVAMPESTKTLQLHSFFPLDHLGSILLACKPAQQTARLSAEDDAGKQSLNKLATFMTCKQLCAFVPVILDKKLVAQMLFFPPSMTILLKFFQMPSEFNNGPLVAALLPWTLNTLEQPSEWLRPYKTQLADAQNLQIELQQNRPDTNFWQEELVPKRPVFKHAIRILQFPYWLHEYMSFADRTYCVWSDETKFKGKALETDLLQSILRKYKDAVPVPIDGQKSLKAVFIHVSSLSNLSKIPNLVSLRSQTVETMFILFGTSSYRSYHYRGGFQEIYPIGGVVTFTASALIEDPISILEKMDEIDEHPLWLGYIIPSVLGLAVRLFYGEDDPLAAFDRGKFVFNFLLTAIDEGKIALMRAPPDHPTCHLKSLPRDSIPRNLEDWEKFSEDLVHKDDQDQDQEGLTSMEWKSPTDDWVMGQTESILRGPRSTLEYCINEFQAQYANVPESRWHSDLEREISVDLGKMQVQPAIMHDYRRFVVLKAERDQHVEIRMGDVQRF